eukprot:gene22019-28113_t
MSLEGCGIRSKLFGEQSLPVADCDILLGRLELQCKEYVRAYFTFYRCYRSRFIQLGAAHPLTVEAEELVLLNRMRDGERLITTMELKDRVSELCWEKEDIHTLQYSVSMFVHRLSDEEVLLVPQLKSIVTNAVQFSLSRLGSSLSPNAPSGSTSESDEVDSDPDSPSSAIAATSAALKEKVSALVLMLLMPGKPVASEGSRPVSTQLSINTSSSKSGDLLSVAESKTPVASPAPRQPLVHAHSTNSINSPTSENKGHHSNSNNYSSSAVSAPNSASKFGSKVLSFRLDYTANDSSMHTPQRRQSNLNSKSPRQTQKDSHQKGVTNANNGEDDEEEGDERFSYRPKNIKPISPNLYRNRLVRQSSSPKSTEHRLSFSIGSSPHVFGRDQDGVLVVVKKATGEEILRCVQTRVLAVGLFPWLCDNSLRERGNSTASTGAAAAVVERRASNIRKSVLSTAATARCSNCARKSVLIGSGGSGGAHPNVAADGVRSSVVVGPVGSVRSSVAVHVDPSAAAAGGGDIDKEQGKANLMALFGKKGSVVGPADGKRASTVAVVSSGAVSGPNWTKEIPRPPPVPTGWPPEPYTGGASGGGGAGGGSRDASGTSTPLGELVGAENTSHDPSKPKLKQLFLVGLAKVEGTLWESNDMDVNPSVLFEDFLDEFEANKAKPVVKSFGGGPGGASPLKSVLNGKGAAKKSAAESLLDPQRAQGINIMLTQFGRRSIFDVAKAVDSFDAVSLPLERINNLLSCIPTPDEINKVAKFVTIQGSKLPATVPAAKVKLFGDVSEEQEEGEGAARESVKVEMRPKTEQEVLNELKLGKPEQYIYIMSRIPKLEQTLNAMMIAVTAKDTCDGIQKASQHILSAVDEVKGSVKLKYLLKAFLELSNVLNKHANNKQRSPPPLTSVKLSSLSELGRTKTNSNMTADMYVVSRILVHVPEVLDVAMDMPSVDDARAVIFNRLQPELKKVEEGVAIMRQLKEAQTAAQAAALAATAQSENEEEESEDLDEGAEGETVSKPPKAVKSVPPSPPTFLDKYLAESQRLLTSASRDLQDAQRDFQELCEYLGEEALDPEGLFGLVSSFVKGISSTAVEARKIREKAKRAERLHK